MRGFAQALRVVPAELRTRFERRVSPEPNTGCWLWAGALNGGYGSIGFARTALRASRIAWVLWRGPLEATENVLHKCDFPPCVNPTHLFLGSQRDNVHDMEAKGRARHNTAGIRTHDIARSARTHCKRGHVLAGNNLSPWALARGLRACKRCQAIRQRELRARAK